MLKRSGDCAPPRTIARLFEAKILDLADELALEEIAAFAGAIARWVSPGRGWLSAGDGNSAPQMPRQLGDAAKWKRYLAWRSRWASPVIGPRPDLPWGMSAAQVVMLLATTPATFEQAAGLLGWQVQSVENLFVRAVRDYGSDNLVRAYLKLPVPVERRKLGPRKG